MKFIFILLRALLAGFAVKSYAQPLIISPEINLPKDSATKAHLLTALNGFLAQKEKPHAENKFILKKDLATCMLLDELKGLEKNAKLKDDNYYKPYSANVIALRDDVFSIQLTTDSRGARRARRNFHVVAAVAVICARKIKKDNLYKF